MSETSSNSHSGPSLTVLLCRGCCCGTARKHPEHDHEAQRAALEQALRQRGARLIVTECLQACAQSNVVVVREPFHATTTWLKGILTSEETERLCAWLSSGGDLPADLRPHVFVPERESTDCLNRRSQFCDRPI